MLSSMTPTIVEDAMGDIFMVLGSPGGSTIITSVAQILINSIDNDGAGKGYDIDVTGL